jgi:hypothetical protein
MTSTIQKVIQVKIEEQQEKHDSYVIEISHRAFQYISIFAVIAFSLFFIKFGFSSLAAHKQTLARQGPIPWIFESLPDAARWGQLGDFMGGLLNPVIGLLTIYLLLANARMQKRELENSLNEMKTSNDALASQANLMEFQSLQNAFFNWLGHYREQLKYLSYVNPSTQQQCLGVEALRARYNHYFSDTLLKKAFGGQINIDDELLKNLRTTGQLGNEVEALLIEKALIKQWRRMYSEQHEAAHSALKVLMALLNWIDKQPLAIMSLSRKIEYFKIVESHLSTTELIYLYFSCWTIMTPGNIDLLNRYDFFRNLTGKSKNYVNFLSKRPSCPFAHKNNEHFL